MVSSAQETTELREYIAAVIGGIIFVPHRLSSYPAKFDVWMNQLEARKIKDPRTSIARMLRIFPDLTPPDRLPRIVGWALGVLGNLEAETVMGMNQRISETRRLVCVM